MGWLSSLRVEEDHARAHLVDERGVSADDRLVGRRPARHVLLDEIVVALDRELAVRHQPLLRGIRAVGARALPDAEALEGIGFGENTGSPLKMSGYIAQPARPRSTASELY